MIKINLIGPIFTTTGYANHTRGLANALNEIADVKISTQLIQNWELQCNDAELKMINKPDDKDRINIIIDMPHNWPLYSNKKTNIGFLVWEGDKIPLSYIDNIMDSRINQIWVPSSHVYEAIKNTLDKSYFAQMIMNKVKIVPHGFNKDIFKPLTRTDNRFKFLVIKGFRNELDRGGMQHAIRAYLQEFSKGEAILLLKLNPAYAMPIDLLNNLIQKYFNETGKNQDNFPDIVVNYDNLTQNELAYLYNECDVLLNPTEGEAFSLPSIEAMACGKPVIATNFGGQTDFIDNSNGWLIDYNLHEIKHEINYEGIRWGKPNIKQLKETMREVYKNPKVKSNKALQTAINYTWDNSAKKAIEHISEIK